MAAISDGRKFFLKLDQLLRSTLWVKNFVEIALSSTVFEIPGFLCFAFLKKIRKYKMTTIFGNEIFDETWERLVFTDTRWVKNFDEIPVVNFYFMKKMVSKSTHILVLFYMCTL